MRAKAEAKKRAAKTLELFEDIPQQSDEWRKIRAGIVTASKFATVMRSGRDGSESKTRDEYMRKLAGEIITGIPTEDYKNDYMARGNAMEDPLRKLYALEVDEEVKQIGFARDGRIGCSPDALVGDVGALEIKTQAPHLLILTLQSGEVPSEHMAQLQGTIWVLRREWVDLRIGFTEMPTFRRRVTRDEMFIRRLSDGVEAFLIELDALVAKVRRFA